MLAQIDLLSRDRDIVELALPAHMMFLMYEEMRKHDWHIREDVLQSLNIACAVPFGEADELTISRCAKRTDDAARSLLHDLSPDDPRHGLLDCCAFVLTAANDFLINPDSQPVLVALALMEEAKQDAEGWNYSEARAYERGKGILTRAILLGYYTKPRFAIRRVK